MKIRIMLASLSVFLIFAWMGVPSATADIIDLGIWDPDLSPIPGESATAELYVLNDAIDAYNASHNPDLPEATYGTDNIDYGGVTSVTLDVSGWTYIKLKWDGMYQFYYIAGEDEVTFDSTVFNQNDQPQALSHYTLFGPTSVPDGDPSTLVLLGVAVMGITTVFRKMQV